MADPVDVIVASGAIITASTVARNAIDKKPHFSPIVFGFLLTAGLLGMAIFAPSLAKMLAYLGLVGAFVVNGPKVFKLVGGLGH
jgi:hypothetical protein